jgi:arylsulfatase A-like enzyme
MVRVTSARRFVGRTALAQALFCVLLIGAGRHACDATNVVVILADDLGYGDLSCYGHDRFQTPRLDRMAAEGVRLTNFNTPMPFCAPTLAALLTGRYPFRCRMPRNPSPDGGPAGDKVALPESERTLAEAFRAAGYATGMVGKWHLGHAKKKHYPVRRGFDEYLGILYSNDMRPVELVDGDRVVEYPVVQATLTERYTQRAVDFITRNRDRPFFLYVAHAMPHKPLAVSETFYGKSGAGLYGDVMAELDASVGRVLDAIAEQGLDEETLVVFTSDNGPWFGGSTGGLRGMKGSNWEGGYRVPCIARWPGRIPAGKVNDGLGVTMDLFATALAAAEIEAPNDRKLDGADLLPMLTGDVTSPHETTFGMAGERLATVRDRRWKLHLLPAKDQRERAQMKRPWVDPRAPDGVTILAPHEQYTPEDYPGGPAGDPPAALALFDLAADPGETSNVAAAHPEAVARLQERASKVMKEFPELAGETSR